MAKISFYLRKNLPPKGDSGFFFGRELDYFLQPFPFLFTSITNPKLLDSIILEKSAMTVNTKTHGAFPRL
jgi:hypothetical protein